VPTTSPAPGASPVPFGIVDRIDAEQTALIADQIDSLLCEVLKRREYNAKSRLQPVDYLCGTLAGRDEIINFIESNLQKIIARGGSL
jgi:hypothetical protein